MRRIVRSIIDSVFIATALQAISLLIYEYAVVDGSQNSFKIILRGVPFRWMTSIDVSDNPISTMFDTQNVMYIDWKWFALDYLIFIAIALIAVAVVKKILKSGTARSR